MKALTTLFAGLVLANAAIAAPATSAASAANAQVGSSSVAATAAGAPAVAAAVAGVATPLVQSVTITKGRSRDEVRAEAVEAVKNHKTALAIQLAQYQ